MKLKVFILIVLIIKTTMVSALCVTNCGTDDTCCKSDKTEISTLDQNPEEEGHLPISDNGDCDCPGCHVHVIPSAIEEETLIETPIFSMTFHWKDLILNPFHQSVFHPPSCLSDLTI